MTDTALDYVGKIIAAYNAAEKAGASALGHALDCGKHLNSAKLTVAAAKGKWKSWREKNLPTVSEETERLYRRLADAAAQQEDFFAKCKGIRDAMKHLAMYETKDGKLVLKPPKPKPEKKAGTGNGVTVLEPPETDTPSSGLEAELENAAADEIINSIADDTDKLEEVAQRSLTRLTPDKVCDALISAWAPDQVSDLYRRLSTYLSSLGASSSQHRRASASA
jgi:hypothetical protein